MTGNKILWIKEENFSPFPQYFSVCLISGGRFGKMDFFLISANLICRSSDTSKYFREALSL